MIFVNNILFKEKNCFFFQKFGSKIGLKMKLSIIRKKLSIKRYSFWKIDFMAFCPKRDHPPARVLEMVERLPLCFWCFSIPVWFINTASHRPSPVKMISLHMVAIIWILVCRVVATLVAIRVTTPFIIISFLSCFEYFS